MPIIFELSVEDYKTVHGMMHRFLIHVNLPNLPVMETIGTTVEQTQLNSGARHASYGRLD